MSVPMNRGNHSERPKQKSQKTKTKYHLMPAKNLTGVRKGGYLSQPKKDYIREVPQESSEDEE